MARPSNYDFGAWATVYGRRCKDGRTIKHGAFKHMDGQIVPIVWNHVHDNPSRVMGNAYLEHRDEGVYMYGSFNDTDGAKDAKKSMAHGDYKSVSIWANELVEVGKEVSHGDIKEVSLCLAGANPMAVIDNIICHSAMETDSAFISMGEEDSIELCHSEGGTNMAEGKGRTVADVIETFNEEQKTVFYAVIGAIMDKQNNKEGDSQMKQNAFDIETGSGTEDVLSHSDLEEIVNEARSGGGHSLRTTFLAHGIENLDYLYPDAKTEGQKLSWIDGDNTWVNAVLSRVHNSPFTRIKTIFADITADEARARGYIRGRRKEEEVFSLSKRTTEPTTIYKKQKFDRDDLLDVSEEVDIIPDVKREMDTKLNKEIARAILIGDGRLPSNPDHIDDSKIRPIWTDDDLFAVHVPIVFGTSASADDRAKAFIRSVIKNRKLYKGSGNPVIFMTSDLLTDCLLLEDTTGRAIYDTVDKLKTKLRVNDIFDVEDMENQSRTVGATTKTLMAIMVNLDDYHVGTAKKGQKSFFSDFDIDYNKETFLLETRKSGSLVKAFSALVFESSVELMHEVEAEDPSSTLFGKLVSDLQDNIFVNDKWIGGTLKYVTGYTGYSGDPALQQGNYLALRFNATLDSVTTVEVIGGHSGPVTLDEDMNCVVRIENKSQKIKVVTTYGDQSVETIYDLRSLTLDRI